MDGAEMKDGLDVTATQRAPQADEFSNRRLIRPSLNRTEHAHVDVSLNRESMSRDSMSRESMSRDGADRHDARDSTERRDRSERHSGAPRKSAPTEQTNAENFYYQKQMQGKTPMVIVLGDGEQIHGVIEWYDKSCIKINRSGSSSLIIYKPSIKYMYKQSENGRK
jgi:sRNA-binding regulator protein Hfq